MVKLREEEIWEEQVNQVENGEPVDGGDNGAVVRMARGLANRTLWLKKRVGELKDSVVQMGTTLDEFDLAWNRITGKPEKYPPEDHYHEGLVPVGGVIGWTLSTPPKYGEWMICDGQNGTPDLRDRFLVGAGQKYRVGDKGGVEVVSLTAEQNGPHRHNSNIHHSFWDAGYKWAFAQWYARPTGENGGNNVTSLAGEGQPHENRPPYYAMYYIMRIR